MKISPARLAAFDVLRRIEKEQAFSSALLPTVEEKLSAKDRALCHELVFGVLRRQMYLDRLIDVAAGEKKLDEPVRVALRLGIYQLIFLDKVPAHAAINESVNLVQRAKKTSAKGLVNAVLRRIARGVPELKYADELDRIAIETSHPRWLIEKWTTEFGGDGAKSLAAANNVAPKVSFRPASPEAGLNFDAYEKSSIVDGCYIASAMTPELRAMADRGEIYFQDEASQLVGSVVANKAGPRFLDVCAAPGGKTTQVALGARARENFLAVAGDVHRSRVELLRETCRRLGAGSVNVVQYDAAVSLPFAAASFDTVLVDAPCSGTGTIRHNPELRYFVRETDFAELQKKQLAILTNASKVVMPGGNLIYSTCSLEVEENEEVCREFIEQNVRFRKLSVSGPARFVTAEGFSRTFPHRDAIDGFFIAEFERLR